MAASRYGTHSEPFSTERTRMRGKRPKKL